MKTMRPIVTGLTICVMLILAGKTLAQDSAKWLSNDRDNDRWIREADGSTFTIDEQATRYPKLTFTMAAIKRGPVTMTIESDASYVTISAGYRRVRFDLSSGAEHTVKLSAGPNPAIALDGKTDDRWTSAWKSGVENPRSDSVELRFGKTSGVKIALLQGAAEVGDSDIAKPQAAPGSEDAATSQILDAGELRKLTDSAVMALRVERGDDAMATASTVTVLDMAGHGVAMLHELLGAKQVTATRAGFPEPIPVELVAIDAEHDLALVKLDLSNPLARAAVRFIPLATDPPKADDTLWALGPKPAVVHANKDAANPLMAGFTGANDPQLQQAKVVKVLNSTTELDRRVQAVLTYSPSTHWLEVDAVLDANHAGAAVVNKRGELVGLGVWTWVPRRRYSQVISAVHIQQLLADHANDFQLLGWDGLAKMMQNPQSQNSAGPVMRFTTFPRLAPPSGAPAGESARLMDIRRTARLLEQNAYCPVCKGEGLIYQRQQVGLSHGGGLATPVYITVPQICTHCEGSGLADADKLQPLLKQVVDTLADVSPASIGDGNKDWITTRDHLTGILQKLVEEHYDGFGKLSEAQAKTMAQSGLSMIGQPLVVVGTLVKKVDVPGAPGSGELPGVRLGEGRSKDAQRVLVSDPVYIGEADQRLALVMGVLSGWVVYSADEPPVAVVSRAWVLPIDQAKSEAAAKKQKDAITEAKAKLEQMQKQLEQQEQQRQRDRNKPKTIY